MVKIRIYYLLIGMILLTGSLLITNFSLSLSNRSVDEYILVEVYYDGEEFNLIEKSLEKGNYPTLAHKTEQEYEVNLIDKKGQILYYSSFNPLLLFSDNIDATGKEIEGGVILLDEANFFIITPSIKDAEKIEVLKDDEKIFEVDVYDVGATSCRVK